MRGRLRWTVRGLFIGAVLLWPVVWLQAQESVQAIAESTKFVTIPITDAGLGLTEIRAEPAQLLVVQVRNDDQVRHCFLFDVSQDARLPEIADLGVGEAPSLECPPRSALAEPTTSGSPVLQTVDLAALQQAVQCGPKTETGRVSGYWAYQVPGPIAPGESATLCFLVTAEGRYPFYDPLAPSQQGVLVVGVPIPVTASTPTSSPAVSPTPPPPETLPESGGNKPKTMLPRLQLVLRALATR